MQRYLLDLHAQCLTSIRHAVRQYVGRVISGWHEEQDLLRLIDGPGTFITYPVHCARVMETAGLLYFLAETPEEQAQVAKFLAKFVAGEPGCAHPISDRYAVSAVAASVALHCSGHAEVASKLLNDMTVWICNRYEDGFGLASVEAETGDEIALLVGYPFAAMEVQKRPQGLLPTALCDLAAFCGYQALFTDMVNDFLATNIVFQYWQPVDSAGQFAFEAKDVVQYPNIQFEDSLSGDEPWQYAEHIRAEPRSFRVAQQIGAASYLALGLLLRDRYFPTLWPELCEPHLADSGPEQEASRGVQDGS